MERWERKLGEIDKSLDDKLRDIDKRLEDKLAGRGSTTVTHGHPVDSSLRPLSVQQEGHGPVSAGDLYKSATPSVVTIECSGECGKLSWRETGSGFSVTANGEILTNYHVIAHAKRATVRLANGDAYDSVSVLDVDRRKDIGLIRVHAVNLPPLRLGHSASVEIGDELFVLGNPLGLQNTLSTGILSGIRQADGYKLFQISAAISPGSSGGPVFNVKGEVVGIAVATVEGGQNLNFAIPIDYAAEMLISSHSPRSLESVFEPRPECAKEEESNEEGRR